MRLLLLLCVVMLLLLTKHFKTVFKNWLIDSEVNKKLVEKLEFLVEFVGIVVNNDLRMAFVLNGSHFRVHRSFCDVALLYKVPVVKGGRNLHTYDLAVLDDDRSVLKVCDKFVSLDVFLHRQTLKTEFRVEKCRCTHLKLQKRYSSTAGKSICVLIR